MKSRGNTLIPVSFDLLLNRIQEGILILYFETSTPKDLDITKS